MTQQVGQLNQVAWIALAVIDGEYMSRCVHRDRETHEPKRRASLATTLWIARTDKGVGRLLKK